MSASHATQKEGKVFEEGSWGAEILEGMEPDVGNGDVLVGRHWNSSLVSPSLFCFKHVLGNVLTGMVQLIQQHGS
jgi:hypothetical protein